MASPSAITLQLTASSIDTYCSDLARRSPTLEKRVTAIDTLITFVSSQANAGEQAKGEFIAIKQTLLDHFEHARTALLAERAQRLQQALIQQQLLTITMLYSTLSRDAFWTLLGQVVQQLDEATSTSLHSWAESWLSHAKQRARQASPYPDAIDFNAAGIDATEYLAMTDLCRYLDAANQP